MQLLSGQKHPARHKNRAEMSLGFEAWRNLDTHRLVDVTPRDDREFQRKH